ncbi:hypothetical protein GCM10011351_06250 [Paraliobacillus quinghaiensis]|uniref:Spore coat protein D n=1 Tax=Paraliobacillus quinghaiensis TaxID=470815 RepID=A0A917WRI6_9BACI|nr:CotD family spore coat protein [Paraliobacillus quinghaiensis]GGM23153.1 hypothetical protein GCM10011351_06250 [Paraliobacillus quinghaiensis]
MRPRRPSWNSNCVTGPSKTVVCPPTCNEVHTCSQSNVQYIHPSHTAVTNHHLVKNTHVYPHATSFKNEVDTVNVYGGSFQVPPQQLPTPGMNQPPRPGFWR